MGLWLLGTIPAWSSARRPMKHLVTPVAGATCIGFIGSLACCGRPEQSAAPADASTNEESAEGCPRPGSLSVAQRDAYLHGQREVRRGIAEPLRWLDELPIAKSKTYRWVNVYQEQAWSLRLHQRGTDCFADARIADGRACTETSSRARLSSDQCEAMIACVINTNFVRQPSDATSDSLVQEHWDGSSATRLSIEARTFYWFEGIDADNSYHIAIRDGSSPSNPIDACSQQWSDVTAKLLDLPLGTVIP